MEGRFDPVPYPPRVKVSAAEPFATANRPRQRFRWLHHTRRGRRSVGMGMDMRARRRDRHFPFFWSVGVAGSACVCQGSRWETLEMGPCDKRLCAAMECAPRFPIAQADCGRRRRTRLCRPTAAHFVLPSHTVQRGPRRLSFCSAAGRPGRQACDDSQAVLRF